MLDAAHHELLARVAAMYYQQDLTQNEIAAALDLSRVKVYRLLKEARETQIARILIDWPIKRSHDLETRLVEQFTLDRALVLRTNATDPALLRRQIAQLAARYLESALVDHDTMSICFGSTTYEVISAIRIDFHVERQCGAGHWQLVTRAQGIRQLGLDAAVGAEAGRAGALLVFAAAGR